MDFNKMLELRLKHDKEHRSKYNVPPAFCPLCSEKVDKLDPESNRIKKQIKEGKGVFI